MSLLLPDRPAILTNVTVASDNPPALLLGQGYSALATARQLGRAGIPVICLDPQETLVRWSRYPQLLRSHAAGANLASRLEALPYTRSVLLAVSDEGVVEVAALPADLRTRFAAAVPSVECLREIIDKAGLARHLAEHRVPHPYTRLIETDDDFGEIPDAIFARAFLKPRHSQAFFAAYGIKGQPVRSRDEAIVTWSRYHQAGHQMILQEYLPGASDQHLFIDGFVDANGSVRALFPRQRKRMFPFDFGNSSCARSIDLATVETTARQLEHLLVALHYRGIFSAEFKRDPWDQRYKLLEINVRPFWHLGFAEACGIALARMYYEDALGRPVEAVRRYSVGKRHVMFEYDRHACWQLYQRGELSVGEWWRDWFGATPMTFAIDDPIPTFAGVLSRIGQRLRPRRM